MLRGPFFRRAGGLNYERHMLTFPGKVDLAELTPFYRSMILAWQKIDNSKGACPQQGRGCGRSHFFHNLLFKIGLFQSLRHAQYNSVPVWGF